MDETLLENDNGLPSGIVRNIFCRTNMSEQSDLDVCSIHLGIIFQMNTEDVPCTKHEDDKIAKQSAG